MRITCRLALRVGAVAVEAGAVAVEAVEAVAVEAVAVEAAAEADDSPVATSSALSSLSSSLSSAPPLASGAARAADARSSASRLLVTCAKTDWSLALAGFCAATLWKWATMVRNCEVRVADDLVFFATSSTKFSMMTDGFPLAVYSL